MKRIYLMLSALVMSAMMWAIGAEVTMSEQGYKDKEVVKKITLSNGISISFSNAKYYDSGSALRLYADCKMTVTATTKISTINLTLPDKDYKGNFQKEYINIDSTSWSNTTNSQARISKVVITLAGGDTISVSGVSLSPSTLTVKIGETAALTPTIIPSNATNKKVRWSSKHDLVSVTNGVILGINEGTDTVTVTTEDGGYTAMSIVTVVRPTKLKGTIYEKVTALKSLAVGDTIVFIYEKDSVAASKVLKTSSSSSYLDTVRVRLMDKQAAADSAMQLIVGKNGDFYTFTTTAGQTLGAHAVKYIDLGSTTGTNEWTLSFDSNGNAILKANLKNNVYLQYNTQSPRFTCYEGKQTNVQIYKRTTQYIGEVSVDTVYLNKSTLPLRKGTSSQLKAIIAPATADNQNVTWTSSETSIADVVDGLVTAKSVGKTTIMVTTEDGGKQATCAVTVTDSVHVSGISLNKTSASVVETESLQLTASVLPKEADNQRVDWISLDESVATVNANGLVTTLRYGEVAIVAASDEFPTLTDTCRLTITALKGDRYHLMTKDSVLNDGDYIVFYHEASSKASAGIEENKGLLSTNATKAENDLVIDDSTPMLLTQSGNNWKLSINKSPIGHKANATDFKTGESTEFSIAIGDDSNAVVTSTIADYPKFYYNTSARIFHLYTSTTMAPIQIYRKVKAPDVPVAVESVTLDADTLYLREGETDLLIATVLPEEAKNKDVEWGSNNEAVATIINGTVTAIAKGETYVWVKTLDGGFTDTCVVRVYASLDQPDVTWNQLQTLDSLKDGVKVLFASVREGEDYVMGVYDYDASKSNIPGETATFTNNQHVVTASESFAYTVSVENGKYIFRDLDGSYLCGHNAKNLSAQDNLDNKARWTATMSEDFEVNLSNVYNTGYVIYNNHNSDMFCCYNAFDKSNMSRVVLYTSNAPEWVEPVRNPELTIKLGSDTITDKLDLGVVKYDPSWGTEVDPYSTSVTLTLVAKYLTEDIALSLNNATAFSLLTSQVSKSGGTATINFSTATPGVYSDILYVTSGTISYAIALTANAKSEDETKPTLSLSASVINLTILLDEGQTSATAEMTFSVKNLVKDLYIKWEKGTIPTGGGESVTILAGDEAANLNFGSANNMDTVTRTNEPILFEAESITEGTYTSALCFYTTDESDKSKCAFEQRVAVIIRVMDKKPESGLGTIKVSNELITDHIDWGNIEQKTTFDVAPYEAVKTVTIEPGYLEDSIQLSLADGGNFELSSSALWLQGGTFEVLFMAADAGTYSDTLYVVSGAFTRAITLSATAVEPTELPNVQSTTSNPYTKIIKNNHLLIYRYGKWYMANGQIVNE